MNTPYLKTTQRPLRLSCLLAVLALGHVTFGQTKPAEKPAPAADEDLVTLDVFTVSSEKDVGYRPTNSITGSRFDTPIKDLPFALQAFTADFIADINPQNLYDIVQYSSGVTARSDDFTEGGNRLSIRGFDTGLSMAFRNGYRGPSITEAAVIERVEVMKGPSSFLYGQIAPGGIVNMITKRPKATPFTKVVLTGGSYDYGKASLDYNTGPLKETGLNFRFNTSYQSDFQYYDPYKAEQWVVAPTLSYTGFKDRIKLTLNLEHFQKHESPPLMMKPNYSAPYASGTFLPVSQGGKRIGKFFPLPADFNIVSYNDFRDFYFTYYGADLDIKLSDNWTARLGYLADESTIRFHATGFLSAGVGANNIPIPATATLPAILPQNAQARRLRYQTSWGRNEVYQIETFGKYQWGPISAKLLLGALQEERESTFVNAQAPGGLWPRPWDLSNPVTWDRTIAVPIASYGNQNGAFSATETRSYWGGVTLGAFNDRLLSLLGVRRTETESGPSFNVSNRVQSITPNANSYFKLSANTPQFGVMYKITPELHVFAAYSESFVPNNARLRIETIDAAGTGINTLFYQAEPFSGEGWDVGIKTDLFNGKISGSVTAYQINNKNIVQTLTTPSPVGLLTQQIQAGEAESRGIEADIVFTVTPAWQILAAYGYQMPIFKNNPNNRALEGKFLQSAVRNKFSMWTKYNFREGGLKGFYVAGGMTWQSKQQQRTEDPDLYLDPYKLFDLQIGYSRKLFGNQTSFTLAAKNLQNREYFPTNNTRGQPRRILFTVATTF